jgi:hypothetical protein
MGASVMCTIRKNLELTIFQSNKRKMSGVCVEIGDTIHKRTHHTLTHAHIYEHKVGKTCLKVVEAVTTTTIRYYTKFHFI